MFFRAGAILAWHVQDPAFNPQHCKKKKRKEKETKIYTFEVSLYANSRKTQSTGLFFSQFALNHCYLPTPLDK
jgi:hypothetical protein